MKKKIFYIFAHQDDEMAIFIQLKKDIMENEPFIFFLTSGTSEKIKKNKLHLRDKESLKTLKALGAKEKNIFFIGRKLNIKHNELYLNAKKVTIFLEDFILKKHMPTSIYTHSWEGGHEDHDTCNLISRRLKKKFNIKNCFQFSLYNAFNTSIIFFRVFNPINKTHGEKIFAKLIDRIYFIRLLFNYTSQIKIWFGLYPFIINHYLFKGYNFIEKLNSDNKIKKPHSGELLYEKRNYCKYLNLKKETEFLFK